MSGSSPTFFHSPAVVALARGAVLIGVLAVLFWGVRTCITAPAEKPMAVAEKLIEAGREADYHSRRKQRPHYGRGPSWQADFL